MNIERLKKIQFELAKKVKLEDKYRIGDIEYVVGVDQAFIGDFIISAAVLLTFPDLNEVRKEYRIEETSFPYIPSFLMFREGDPAVRVVKRILEPRSLILVDGSGIAHPRRCGLATYIAIKTGEPSVGVTKKKLYGSVDHEGGLTVLKDNSEIIGYVLKSCKRCKPIYISPGNYISPKSALVAVKMCLRGHKLPEPIRLAHVYANYVKRELI
ncbi:endonuclease V [Archaeoglobales archaeon ex4484_92]|nr:MAG: endonuclease V [Archaeoglobales archaeon ex4484_92]